MAFHPGDRVVLPPYGIGVIRGTCDRRVGSETQTYYHIEFQHSSSRAFVPVHTCTLTRMRAALTQEELPDLLHALQYADEIDLSRQWSVRHQQVGSIVSRAVPFELAAMIGQLHRWNVKRALSDLDRHAFHKAIKLLRQEIDSLTGATAQAIRVFLEVSMSHPGRAH